MSPAVVLYNNCLSSSKNRLISKYKLAWQHFVQNTAPHFISATSAAGIQVAQFIKAGKLDFSIGRHWMVDGFGLVQLYDYLHGFPLENTQPLFSLIPVTRANVDTCANGLLNERILSPKGVRNLSRVHNPKADLPGFIDSFSKN